jgi:hypothetical protein
MTIQIKDEETLEGFLIGYHPLLIDIVLFVLSIENDMVITCGFRAGDTGVHGTFPCRGIDLRSWIYLNPSEISARINERWIYDPNRPDMNCCELHKTKTGGMHFHIQVHPNTRLRKEF